MSEAAPQLQMADCRLSQSDVDLVAVLEERLASLVERHREALKTIEELQTQLQDRRTQISELSRRVEQDEVLRDEARVRLVGVIERLIQVEAAVSAQGGDGARDGG